MNRSEKSWLLPTAFVLYVALSASRGAVGLRGAAALGVAAGVAFALKWARRRTEAGLIATSPEGVRTALIGVGIYGATLLGPPDDGILRAANGLAQGMVTAGVLLCTARLASPPGLLQGHPAARSLDALALSVVLWAATTSAALLRALFPDNFPLDPIALDTAFIFSSLGSLLLLCAAFARTRLLRGLELGVGDRAQAALALSLAGTIVGAGSGFVHLASADRVSGGTLVVTALAVVLVLSGPDPARISQLVRGLVALLLLGTPTALAGAWFAARLPEHGQEVALVIAVLGMLVGLIARSLATPLGPAGSRWLGALTQAMDAALLPEPDMALRAALMALRKAEPSSENRPEIFRADPPGMLSVDIAGYLSDAPVEFPLGVQEVARHEPSRTLRLETLIAAQVRKPEVRSLVTWFQAHRAKTATVLIDEAGPIGILALPRGSRKSHLTMEEAEMLSRLCERLAGLLSVTSSLRRARERELSFRKRAQEAKDLAQSLTDRLQEHQDDDHSQVEARAEILRATAHGPAAQIKLQDLEALAQNATVHLETPLGVDPVPWAAHLHLTQTTDPRPLIVIDCSERGIRSRAPWDFQSEASPWSRAGRGTLLLVYPGALSTESQDRLCSALELHRPRLVIIAKAASEKLTPRLERQLIGPLVRLPALAERAEDLQALIINELAQLGLTERGAAIGIEKAALVRLIDQPFPGNDAELKGILSSAVGRATGDVVRLSDLDLPAPSDDPEAARNAASARSRARLAPRSRRR